MLQAVSGRGRPLHTLVSKGWGVGWLFGQGVTSLPREWILFENATLDVNLGYLDGGKVAARLRGMAVFTDDVRTDHLRTDELRTDDLRMDELRAAETKSGEEAKSAGRVEALVQLLRGRSYEEIRQRMYDSAPGSAWWAACRAELELRNGQQVAEASVAMSRVSEKMLASTQHFEQLADTLHEATHDIADLLRGTQEAGRRLEIAVYVTIGITLVQLFNLIFEVFRKR